MTRTKCSVISHKKHKKILKESKGYYGLRSKSYKVSKQSIIKSGQYSYRDRKVKKREFRKLWIIRINAELKKYNISYSKFINILNINKIKINRKILSEIIQINKNIFEKIISNII